MCDAITPFGRRNKQLGESCNVCGYSGLGGLAYRLKIVRFQFVCLGKDSGPRHSCIIKQCHDFFVSLADSTARVDQQKDAL